MHMVIDVAARRAQKRPMHHRFAVPLALLLALAACTQNLGPITPPVPDAAKPLKLASWNLEFLAETDGAGCEPRGPADYDGMRRIADSLDADVIAFQEAENVAAAARVFDPARFTIVMEERPGAPSGTCGGEHPKQKLIRQAVGFAIRKNIPFDRNADVTSLMLGNAQLRSGVDIIVRPAGKAPMRLLGIHLKSGCFAGITAKACPVLSQQVPALEGWIDAAAKGPVRFAMLGDWNRRLALPGDTVWQEIDDGDPVNADLRLADDERAPACDPRYDSFIDHVVLDKRAGAAMRNFTEIPYAAGEKHYSDHCPITVTLAD